MVEYLPILLVFGFAALVAGAMLGIPHLLAPRRLTPAKLEVFECGKDPVMVMEGRFPIKFWTIAVDFIIFDIELIFLWPWAVLLLPLGWYGLGAVSVFLGVVMFGFLYIWRKGGLEWE